MKTFTKFLASLVLAIIMLPAVASAQLVVSQGGTGLTSVAANNIPYGVSASLRLGSEAAFTYNPSTNLFTTTYASTTGLSATNGDLSKLTVAYASSTGFTATNATIGTATGTAFFGFGLTDCDSAGNATTYDVTTGKFACGTITGVADGVSNWNVKGTGYIGPTTTVGISVAASSTIGGGTGATGLTINGTATSTDLVVRNLTSALTLTGSTGLFSEYAGSSCTNQFVRSLDAVGAATCATVANTDLANSTVSYGGISLSLGGSDATPAFNLIDATGLPISTGVAGLGTSVATALGVNVGTAGSFVVNGGALGTPSSGTLTNATGLPISTGVSGLGSNVATLLATFSSANLATALTDETGTAGSAVFSTNPLLAGFRSNASSTIGGGTGATGLTVDGTATTTNLKVTALTASRLIATAADKLISSVSTLTSWIAGTSNEITVTDDGDGTVTLSLPSTIDLGGKTSLEIPNGTAPTVDTDGECAIDTTSGQLKCDLGTNVSVIGNGNIYPAFTYATTTAWTGTTTIPLGTAYVAETWNGVQCYTDAGTLSTRFGDGTNWTNVNNSSTTVGTTVFTSNNTFTSGEKRYVEVGTAASSPTKISCTVSKSITAD